MNPPANLLANPWTQLQTELCDLAFTLDRRGRHDAADIATTVAARIGELLADETRQDARSDSHPLHPVRP